MGNGREREYDGAQLVWVRDRHHVRGQRRAECDGIFLYVFFSLPFAVCSLDIRGLTGNGAVQSTFNAVLYAWTPEAFPASVRGSASGLASFWGRLASIIAPLAAARASPGNAMGQLYMAGAGVVVCVLLAACLPDTRRVDVL
jgi:hypothetical protein